MPRNSKGFTLIELIVVIAIIGILALITVPAIKNYIDSANLSVAKTNGAAVLSACERIKAMIFVGDESNLNSSTIYEHSSLSVLEGMAEQNNSIVVQIVNNTLNTIWSMKGGQLAMWTRDRGWVLGAENVAFIEDEFSELAFALANDNTAYVVKDGRNFSKSSITIPSTYKGLPVIGIANSAFNNTKTLQTLNIQAPLTSIGVSSFHGCSSLTTVTISSSVETIGNNAFNNCSSLETVRIGRSASDEITEGGSNMFIGCPDTLKIYVTADSVNDYRQASGWQKDALKIYPG